MQSAIWAAGADEDYATDTKISGEPVIKTMAPDNLESKMDKLGLGFRPETEAVSAYGLWKLQKQKRTFKEQYLAHWKATKEKTGTGRPVDAIISPVCPWAGAEHGSSKWVSIMLIDSARILNRGTAMLTTRWSGMRWITRCASCQSPKLTHK